MDPGILTQHSVLKTNDLKMARYCVSQNFCDHKLDIDDGGKALSLVYNHAAGKHVSVNYLHYGANVAIDPGMLESFFLLQIPLSGQSHVQHRGESVDANVDTATVLNPDRPTKMRWSDNCRMLLLQIDKTYMDEVALDITGTPLPGPVRFRTSVNLTSHNGSMLKRRIMSCVNGIEHGQLFQGNNANGSQDLQVEFELTHSLLMLQESNVSHIIEKPNLDATTHSLQMAVDYIHAHFHESITMKNIASNANVCVRALQKGFRVRYGLTPMRYLKNVRLDHARYQLMTRSNTPSVTTVAHNAGFTHLGRFAQEYKERFGLSPKRTKQTSVHLS
ncbi:MAG: AraC family transcriptional regulator [Granulosicoccus sp.]